MFDVIKLKKTLFNNFITVSKNIFITSVGTVKKI